MTSQDFRCRCPPRLNITDKVVEERPISADQTTNPRKAR
jgi:hypothetical protein